ncbi:MAG: DNA internalization-related competence protein ComEC/Rec2 [Pseudomonadales bacterium]|nr:DNA internalization-related competence protein ComEC/Rec2 [Pseudomonadales bacterium]
MIVFSLGIFVAGFIPRLPPEAVVGLFLLLGLLALKIPGLHLAGIFSLGIAWALLRASLLLMELLPPALENRDIWIEGTVAGLPQESEGSRRFLFSQDKRCPQPALHDCDFAELPPLKRQLLLSAYADERVEPGQRWRLKVRLKRPHGFANPGGFDYEAWLLQQGISATGYIRADTDNQLLRDDAGPNFARLRFSFRENYRALFGTESEPVLPRHTGLIHALTIGDRYLISNSQWELFSATGTNHLMVISGLHVGFMALLAYHLLSALMRCSTRFMLRCPAQQAGAIGAMLAAFGYSGLAGFSLPAQRALIMVLVLMGGRLTRRHTLGSNSLALALGLVLLRDPMAVQAIGFWLSFGAVTVLMLQGTELANRAEYIGMSARFLLLCKTQLFLFIGLLPLMLLFFQRTSLLAPLVNPLAIPYVSLLVVPLCLGGLLLTGFAPAVAELLFRLADFLLGFFVQTLEYLVVRTTDLAVMELPALPWWASALLIVCVLGLLLLPGRQKLWAAPGLLTLLLPVAAPMHAGELRLHVLDVGQGLAVVVETASHRLVYDTGPAYSPRFDAGSGVLLPFLRARNIRSIDAIVISHGHDDHAGGLTMLAKRFPAARLLAGEPEKINVDGGAETCRAGQSWHWDDVDFEFLHPDQAFYGANNISCVLKISSGRHAVLLTGDIEALAEQRLLSDPALQTGDGSRLQADILVAPHHGSRSSSGSSFVRAVDPAYVVFSAGYLNAFGHPHPQVTARYRQAQVVMFNTAHDGAVSFAFSAGSLGEPQTWREQRKRWWSGL